MFRAFDLRGIDIGDINESWQQKGRELRAAASLRVRQTLESFLNDDGSIDGAKMRDDWFPEISADIFLSHSHADELLALCLAGWASEELKLNVFIDSSVWGNSSDLLKAIDDRYCRNLGAKTYSYERRNHSTSHVHMMLATALSMMIDKTECAWVLNTGNSITSREAVDATKSPWIFSEIATMGLVRRRTAEEHRGKDKVAKAEVLEEKRLVVLYPVPLMAFAKLDLEALVEWGRRRRSPLSKAKHSLDLLYGLVPEAK